jgi:hypothetical protein
VCFLLIGSNYNNNAFYLKECINKEYTMNIKMLRAAVAGLVLSVSGFASAGLITSTNGLIDTSTNFEWLSLSPNYGISYDDMNLTNLNGFQSLGFRYATIDEVGALWVEAGITLPALYVLDTSDQLAAGDVLANLLGTFHFNDSNHFLQGMTSSIALNGTSILTPWLRATCLNGTGCSDGVNYGGYSQTTSEINSNTSSWLVRNTQAVPEPSTLAIFALGIIGLASRRFKKQ